MNMSLAVCIIPCLHSQPSFEPKNKIEYSFDFLSLALKYSISDQTLSSEKTVKVNP